MPNWGLNNSSMLNSYLRQFPKGIPIWKDVQFIIDPKQADYQIILDETNIEFDPSKVIFMGREPDHIAIKRWPNEKCIASYHHELGNSWLGSTWWVGLTYDELKQICPPIKQKNLSVIDSGKLMTLGHRKRVDFIERLIATIPDELEVWGKIVDKLAHHKRHLVMQKLPQKKKDDALIPYRYNLSIENGATNNYFSEKFIDPLLCWAMPIYYGCKNIDKFFPAGSYITFDVDDKFAYDKIIEIVQSNYYEDNIDNIAEARELILEKYNLISTIELAINNKLTL